MQGLLTVSQRSSLLVNIVEHSAAKQLVETNNRAKSAVNTGLEFMRQPETLVQINTNIFLSTF